MADALQPATTVSPRASRSARSAAWRSLASGPAAWTWSGTRRTSPETGSLQGMSQIADDRLEDKQPVFDPEFVAGHEPAVTSTYCWTGKMLPHTYTLLVEESAEVRLPPGRAPPTRDELRAICDAHATKDQIVQALESP